MAQQTIDIGSAANDGTGDPIRDAFDKCNDNFTELYTGLTGLLELKGSTDCSANPNYPAASKGDTYVVSVAGKIGGASGKVVEVGDIYFANADNAGGTEASVGTSWNVVQGNIVGGSAITELDDIPDVNAPAPSAGDCLAWDDGASEWVASPLPGGGSGGTVPDGGSDGQVLTKQSGVDQDVDWSDRGAHIIDRVFVSATNTTFTINNTAYTSHFESLSTAIDLDAFPATHFRIVAFGQSSEAAQTATFQLDTTDGGGTPASAGGNDLVITNTQGLFDSGWIARADALTGFRRYFGLLKGSNSTVDVNIRHLTVMWKID